MECLLTDILAACAFSEWLKGEMIGAEPPGNRIGWMFKVVTCVFRVALFKWFYPKIVYMFLVIYFWVFSWALFWSYVMFLCCSYPGFFIIVMKFFRKGELLEVNWDTVHYLCLTQLFSFSFRVLFYNSHRIGRRSKAARYCLGGGSGGGVTQITVGFVCTGGLFMLCFDLLYGGFLGWRFCMFVLGSLEIWTLVGYLVCVS